MSTPYPTQILDPSPETILHNGHFVCVDTNFSNAEAVAIKNGRFVGVGKNQEICALASAQTRMIDLGGRMVLPGLIDSHNHMTKVGLGLVELSLGGCACIADIVQLIGQKINDLQPGEWVKTALIGEPAISHLLKERRYPTRSDLDSVSPNNPVCIVSFHVLIVNSYALKMIQVDKNTQEPEGGRIGLDPDTGEPTGIFYEEPAMELIRRVLPLTSHHDRVNGLQEACRQYHAVGITSISEHGVSHEELRAYQEVWNNRKLSVRSYLHLLVDANQTMLEIEKMIQHLSFMASPGFGDESLKIGGLKLFVDGGVGIGTALMRQPYTTASGKVSEGVQVISTEKFQKIVSLANQYNLRVSQHDSGGKAIDLVLEAYERVHAEHPIDDKRFIMVHCQFPSSDNFEKIRKLGAIVATQTMFLHTMGLGYRNYLGDTLVNQAIPVRDWIDQGIPVSLGSDAPVNSFDPILGIWHAVTRKEKTTGEVFGKNQRITRQEAIRGYTIHAAHASFEEGIKGSIEPGKLADLIVLSEDILTCPEEEIQDVKVEMTLVGGEIVYEV